MPEVDNSLGEDSQWVFAACREDCIMVQITICTTWIDWGYRVKLPLSQMVDSALGRTEDHPYSVVAFLDTCYETRRPMFEDADAKLTQLMSVFALK